MQHCKYHPLTPATYLCNQCDIYACDHCVDEGKYQSDKKCFVCAAHVQSLGAAHTAEPFWRRLDKSFRYPLRGSCLWLIGGVSLLSSLLLFLPLGVLLTLIVFGAFLKYCFICLENSAEGDFEAPDIAVAYQGGLGLLLRLVLMSLVLGAMITAVGALLGETAAELLAALLLAALPALLINYAVNGSVMDAFNVVAASRLIAAIGMPYGLLLVFILIMFASQAVIVGFIDSETTLLARVLRSVVSGYYTVVVFHLMGYMIFQYQGVLGFSARRAGEIDDRSEPQRLLAQISVVIKEGDFDRAATLFGAAINSHPDDSTLYRHCFDFLIASHNRRHLASFAERYFDYLVRAGRQESINSVYKKILPLHPEYKPQTAALRHQLAQACYQAGDSKAVVRLLSGLHKQFPHYPGSPDAYELLAEALANFPKMADQAARAKQLAEVLRRRPEPKRASIDAAGEKPSPKPAPGDESESAATTSRVSTSKDLPPIDFL